MVHVSTYFHFFHSFFSLRATCLLTLLAIAGGNALSQTAPPTASTAQPDVLLLKGGEKLTGHLVRAMGSSVTFHSDTLGELSIDWSKIQELHSSQRFLVVEKNLKLKRGEDTSRIPQGVLSMADQKIAVDPGGGQPPQTIAIGDAAYVVDESTFRQTLLHTSGPFSGWRGAITAGASLVEATQNSRTFTGSAHFIRAMPVESWRPRRNRTSLDLSASYGTLTQPDTPKLKTEIYHAGGEHDEYFTPRVYALGEFALDHNFSQGLDLQQTYGGGLGWTVLQRTRETLDLKGSMNFQKQRFRVASPGQNRDQDLFGSTFAEHYSLRLPHGIVIDEQLSANPTWSMTNDYSGAGNASVAMPVYKRLSLSLTTADTFLNDPPPGFKKNSFQFATGVTYTHP